MKIRVLASTKPGYEFPVEEAVNFSGKAAGICYMPDTVDTLFSEPVDKTIKRANGTMKSGHHSVFGHPQYTFVFEEIPKILAMILNNEKVYNTSEKSARYTKMTPSEEEKVLYEKWIKIFEQEIQETYPKIDIKDVKKLALENARYLISVFTPATTMEHTLDLRQLNYVLYWMEDFVNTAEDNAFNRQLIPILKEFLSEMQKFRLEPLNTEVKGRKLSLFAERDRMQEWGESYSTNYFATFSQVAQAQRHRTLYYEISLPEEEKFFIPYIIRHTCYEEEWLKDITSLADKFPQGMLVKVNERGTVEKFVEKCYERLCGRAQLEIAIQTELTLINYMNKVQDVNPDVYDYLSNYSKGARCTFEKFKCTLPCIWGNKEFLSRKV